MTANIKGKAIFTVQWDKNNAVKLLNLRWNFEYAYKNNSAKPSPKTLMNSWRSDKSAIDRHGGINNICRPFQKETQPKSEKGNRKNTTPPHQQSTCSYAID